MSKRTGIIAAIVVIIIVVAIILIARGSNNSSNSDAPQNNAATTESNDQGTTPTTDATPTPTQPGNTGTGSTGTGTKRMSYADALKFYGANRIQIDQGCQAHPATATFKAGTDVMFDNRAVGERVIAFNGKTYKIPAGDYTVIRMTAATYPGIAYVDCDNSQNVAKITIQK